MNVHFAKQAVFALVVKARAVVAIRNAAARLLAATSREVLAHPRWEVRNNAALFLKLVS
jgi:hypothetical protein